MTVADAMREMLNALDAVTRVRDDQPRRMTPGECDDIANLLGTVAGEAQRLALRLRVGPPTLAGTLPQIGRRVA